MKKKIKSGVCLLFVMAGLPCLIVALILGIKECPPVRNETDFEDYIAVLTAMQIDWEAPKESIKAQTVIARGNFYLQWEKGEEKQKAEEEARKKIEEEEEAARKAAEEEAERIKKEKKEKSIFHRGFRFLKKFVEDSISEEE